MEEGRAADARAYAHRRIIQQALVHSRNLESQFMRDKLETLGRGAAETAFVALQTVAEERKGLQSVMPCSDQTRSYDRGIEAAGQFDDGLAVR